MRTSPFLVPVPLALLLVGCSSGGGREDTTATGVGPSDGSGAATGATDSATSGVMTGAGTSTTGPLATTTGADDTVDDGPNFDVGGVGTTGAACIPTADVEEVCDGLDDDCNGFVDDIDEGGDGICDCLAIAIIGTPGSLASSQFQQWLIDRGTSADRIDPAVVDATVLDDYDVVILDQLTREYTPAEAAAFDAWVTAGGGLMSMTGHTSSPVSAQQWPNGILGPMGLEYQGPLLNGPVTDFEPHPITVGLTSVTFLGGFEVVATMPGLSDVVARLPNMAPAAQAQERGAGKVFVWGDEWIEYDSEWAALPEITQLWVNIFEWITPTEICAPPAG
jgi:hypothetical protein